MKTRALILLLCLLCCRNALADRGTPEIVTETQPKQARTAVIRCAGDFVIHDNLLSAALKAGGGKSHVFSGMLSEVAEYMGEADYTFTNVDGVMGTDEFARKHGFAGYPSFSTPNALIYDLKDIGVDLLTLANNHALDYWFDGLLSTVTAVRDSGLASVGGYRSPEEKQTPCIVTVNDIKIGFLNYTDGLNQMDKRRGLDKAALVYGVDFLERADIASDVKRLKAAGAELIVCYMHWGIEYRDEPCQSQKSNAVKLANAGVDVIIGGGPHKVQLADYVTVKDPDGNVKQVLCLYSLGNFLSDQRGEGRDCGIIFDFTVTRDENGKITVSDPCYRTTWVWRKQNGSTFTYKILFSDDPVTRPDGMSNRDWQRLNESAGEIRKRMSAGCALPAGNKTEENALIDLPSLREK